MRSTRPYLHVALLIVAGLLVWHFVRRSDPGTRQVAPAAQPPPLITESAAVSPASLPSLPAPESVKAPAEARNSELAATARMYAAHRSLRAPEVADPDSTANHEVLQTMVTKALTRAATSPSAPPSSR